MRREQAGLTVPPAGSSYPLALVAAGSQPNRWAACGLAVVGVLLVLSGFSLIVPSVNWAVLSLAHAWSGSSEPLAQFTARAIRFETVSGMVAAHLALGSLTLVVVGVLRLVHRRRAAWLWSVSPGVRWRYGLAVLLLASVILNLVLVLSEPPQIRPQPGAWLWLLAVAVTAPLQALGEEVLFRGYLLQAIGMAVRSPMLAILLSPRCLRCSMARRTCPCSCSVSDSEYWRAGWSGAPVAWKRRLLPMSPTTCGPSPGPS